MGTPPRVRKTASPSSVTAVSKVNGDAKLVFFFFPSIECVLEKTGVFRLTKMEFLKQLMKRQSLTMWRHIRLVKRFALN